MDAAVVLQQSSIGSVQLCGCDNSSGSLKILGSSSWRFSSKSFAADIGFFRKQNCNSKPYRLTIVRASSSQTSLPDKAAISTSPNTTNNSRKPSSEGYLFFSNMIALFVIL